MMGEAGVGGRHGRAFLFPTGSVGSYRPAQSACQRNRHLYGLPCTIDNSSTSRKQTDPCNWWRSENLVFKASWAAAGHATPPTFHGVAYDSMQDNPATATDEAHNFEPHFDRHRLGVSARIRMAVFEPFNPAVSCAHHGAQPATASN